MFSFLLKKNLFFDLNGQNILIIELFLDELIGERSTKSGHKMKLTISYLEIFRDLLTLLL